METIRGWATRVVEREPLCEADPERAGEDGESVVAPRNEEFWQPYEILRRAREDGVPGRIPGEGPQPLPSRYDGEPERQALRQLEPTPEKRGRRDRISRGVAGDQRQRASDAVRP